MNYDTEPQTHEFNVTCPKCGAEVVALGTKFVAEGSCSRCGIILDYSPMEIAKDAEADRQFEAARDARFD